MWRRLASGAAGQGRVCCGVVCHRVEEALGTKSHTDVKAHGAAEVHEKAVRRRGPQRPIVCASRIGCAGFGEQKLRLHSGFAEACFGVAAVRLECFGGVA
ncbi:hypothetical protein GUJ93_ZPchr0013g34320 [Zizania palustris]|uniref:Uncharacterized protein n=1 Tax=Zizania palustris TaxID=103762 RepID=A0A8J6BXE7_ZIZPA|nr:hypothetical protein GUJ93_ZPchr0013g34320 [Zizania palustris]